MKTESSEKYCMLIIRVGILKILLLFQISYVVVLRPNPWSQGRHDRANRREDWVKRIIDRPASNGIPNNRLRTLKCTIQKTQILKISLALFIAFPSKNRPSFCDDRKWRRKVGNYSKARGPLLVDVKF